LSARGLVDARLAAEAVARTKPESSERAVTVRSSMKLSARFSSTITPLAATSSVTTPMSPAKCESGDGDGDDQQWRKREDRIERDRRTELRAAALAPHQVRSDDALADAPERAAQLALHRHSCRIGERSSGT
jgi:hypothetical protein